MYFLLLDTYSKLPFLPILAIVLSTDPFRL